MQLYYWLMTHTLLQRITFLNFAYEFYRMTIHWMLWQFFLKVQKVRKRRVPQNLRNNTLKQCCQLIVLVKKILLDEKGQLWRNFKFFEKVNENRFPFWSWNKLVTLPWRRFWQPIIWLPTTFDGTNGIVIRSVGMLVSASRNSILRQPLFKG